MLLCNESINWMAEQLKQRPSFVNAMMAFVMNSYNDYLDFTHTWCVEIIVTPIGRVILSMSLVPMGDDFATVSRQLGGVYVRKYWRNDKNRITDNHC